MKKAMSALIIAALLCGSAACSNTGSDSSEGSLSSGESASEPSTEAITEGTAATEPVTSTGGTTAPAVSSSASQTTSEAVQTASSSSSQPESSYRVDENGAVVFETPAAEVSDEVLISAAQQLYDTACVTNWNYTVGSPYPIDFEQYIENSMGWQMYLITDGNITSMADVRADYQKVFSSRYPDELDSLFMEQDGHVYCLAGARGSDIFYAGSEVISVNSKDGDEYFFTVRSSYDGSPWDEESYYKDEQFSAVILPDGSWRAGVFRLPY